MASSTLTLSPLLSQYILQGPAYSVTYICLIYRLHAISMRLTGVEPAPYELKVRCPTFRL